MGHIRARIRLNVVAPMPSNQSSTPMAAFQSESTRVRREVSVSEVRSSVATAWPATSPRAGPKGGLCPRRTGGRSPRQRPDRGRGQPGARRTSPWSPSAASYGEFPTANLGGQPVRAPHRLRGSGEQHSCHSPKPEVRPRGSADFLLAHLGHLPGRGPGQQVGAVGTAPAVSRALNSSFPDGLNSETYGDAPPTNRSPLGVFARSPLAVRPGLPAGHPT